MTPSDRLFDVPPRPELPPKPKPNGRKAALRRCVDCTYFKGTGDLGMCQCPARGYDPVTGSGYERYARNPTRCAQFIPRDPDCEPPS